MKATDGSFIELFEWLSPEAIEQAHDNATVLQMWQEFDAVSEYVPAGTVEEFSTLFPEFSPVN